MNKILLFLLLTGVVNCFGQKNIQGNVIDAVTKQPITAAKIYINNSTIGTSTMANGKFALATTISNEVEIVVSHSGYKKASFTVLVGAPKSYKVELVPQNQLGEVLARKDKNTAKWAELFRQNLIGIYNHSGQFSVIQNPEDLIYNFDSVTNELQVFAKAPIIIHDKSTHYKITAELEFYRHNLNTGTVRISQTLFYEDLPSAKKDNFAKYWRRNLYYGSNLHLMRSVYLGDLTDAGFKFYRYSSIKNKEKERVEHIVGQKLVGENYKNFTPTLTQLFKNKDTSKYYQTIIDQPSNLKIDTVPIVISNFITTDSSRLGRVNFKFTDTIMVKYRRPLAHVPKSVHPDYLEQSLANYPRQFYHQYISLMYLPNKEGINIWKKGDYDGDSVFEYGRLTERKIDGSLPIDFDPDKN